MTSDDRRADASGRAASDADEDDADEDEDESSSGSSSTGSSNAGKRAPAKKPATKRAASSGCREVEKTAMLRMSAKAWRADSGVPSATGIGATS